MNLNFVPEMHDIGKLIPKEWQDCPKINEDKIIEWHGQGDVFGNVNWNQLGVLQPQTATWQGFLHHHHGQYANLTTSPAQGELKANILLLMLADRLAATASRASAERLGLDESHKHVQVYKLWNPKEQSDTESLAWAPVRDVESLKDMIEFVNSDPADASSFFAKYRDYLLRIPEEKMPPSSVTSLYTHLEMVGKFYRILKKHVRLISSNGDPKALEYMANSVTSVDEARSRWWFQLLKCHLRFPQTPVRARDLNVFYLLEQHAQNLLNSKYRDYVLFCTTDTLWLFLPLDGSVTVATILQPYLDDGFYAECEVTTFNLDNLYPDFKSWKEEHKSEVLQSKVDKTKERISRELADLRRQQAELKPRLDSPKTPVLEKQKLGKEVSHLDSRIKELERQLTGWDEALKAWQEESERVQASVKVTQLSIFPEIVAATEVIEDAICELCQMRAATRLREDPRSGISESLCDVCYRIQESERFAIIAHWEDQDPDTQLAWVKMHLDYDWASLYIRMWFEEFVDQLVTKSSKSSMATAEKVKASLRPIALLADFTKDYQALLASFYNALNEAGFTEERIKVLSGEFKDFYVIKLEDGDEILTILRIFKGHLAYFFPKLQREKNCPVRISVSVGPVKFPFFDHWSFLQRPAAVINVQIPGRAKLEIDPEKFADLQSIQLKRVGTFLHKLADIEAKTGSKILTRAELREARGQERELIKLYNLYASGRLDADEILSYYKIIGG